MTGLLIVIFAGLQDPMSKDLPLLADTGELKLRVVNTEVVARISDGRTVLTAGAGHRLVVVTIKGIAPKPCRLAFEAREFAAVYETATADGRPQRKQVQVTLSSAIAVNTARWAMLPARATGAVQTSPLEAGAVTVKMAVVLPDRLSDFLVRYPTVAAGRANLNPGRLTGRPGM